MDICD